MQTKKGERCKQICLKKKKPQQNLPAGHSPQIGKHSCLPSPSLYIHSAAFLSFSGNTVKATGETTLSDFVLA